MRVGVELTRLAAYWLYPSSPSGSSRVEMLFATVQQGDGGWANCLLLSWNPSSVLLDCELSLPISSSVVTSSVDMSFVLMLTSFEERKPRKGVIRHLWAESKPFCFDWFRRE